MQALYIVASLGKGTGPLAPQVQLLRNPHLAPQDSALLVEHLQKWIVERIREALGPLAKPNHKLKDAGRALLDRLQQNLGSMPTECLGSQRQELTGLAKIKLVCLSYRQERRPGEQVFPASTAAIPEMIQGSLSRPKFKQTNRAVRGVNVPSFDALHTMLHIPVDR